MAIRLSRHAREKLDILARHGVHITEADIVATVREPDHLEDERFPMIAQRRHGERHVLRVVFRREGDDIVVITVYPGRRQRYES